MVTNSSRRSVSLSMKGFCLCFFSLFSVAAFSAESGTYLMPMNCTELLPDNTQFVGCLDAVAKGQVTADRALAKRVFRLLALREKMNDAASKYRDVNPIDLLIRRTLCFYREQKEPMAAVPYNNVQFVTFLRANLREL